MFDKYNFTPVSRPTSMSASINVKEHRAPTDDSIRLLNEMQERARESLVKRYVIDDNYIKGSIYYFEDLLTNDHIVEIRFALNGKEYHTSERITIRSVETESDAKQRLVVSMSNAILELLSYNVERL